MMWPRLELLRELLSEDGSIWVSHYLKVVMDEVLGRSSFVADIVWQRTHTRENRTDIANVHDNILVYAKNRAIWREVRIRYRSPKSNSRDSRILTVTHGEGGRRFPFTQRPRRDDGASSSSPSRCLRDASSIPRPEDDCTRRIGSSKCAPKTGSGTGRVETTLHD